MNAPPGLIDDAIAATPFLRVTTPDQHPSAPLLGTERMGTGVAVDGGRHILTAHYLILGAGRIDLTDAAGGTMQAGVVACDFQSGLAVLVPERPYPGSFEPRLEPPPAPGEETFLVAAAEDGARRLSSGLLTAKGPFDAWWEYCLDDAYRVAEPNPGYSGGPLVDRQGRVLGVVALSTVEIGRLSLAIPIALFLEHRDELVEHGGVRGRPRRAWIGIFCQPLDDRVVVAGVLPAGPAASAGLRPGDVFVALGGREVSGRRELYEEIWKNAPGDVLPVRIQRGGEALDLEIEAGDVEKTLR